MSNKTSYLPFHKYRMISMLQVAAYLKNIRTQNPIFRSNLEEYINQCMFYDVIIAKKCDIKEPEVEEDIW